jgi:pyruvate,water dikinase
MQAKPLILNLNEVDLSMLNTVGGKNASLGEMIQKLSEREIQVPGGFVVTVHAFESYLQHNELKEKISHQLEGLDTSDIISLRKKGSIIRNMVADGTFPDDLKDEIVQRYRDLSKVYGNEATDVAVRSSATAEDLPDASFAGQQETFLNVRGSQSLQRSSNFLPHPARLRSSIGATFSWCAKNGAFRPRCIGSSFFYRYREWF